MALIFGVYNMTIEVGGAQGGAMFSEQLVINDVPAGATGEIFNIPVPEGKVIRCDRDWETPNINAIRR